MTTVYKTPVEVDDFDIAADLRRVLERHDRFKPILDFDLKIDLSIAYSDKDDAVKLHGAPALAKIKIIGPEDRARGNGDVRITVDGPKYERRNQRQRDAILCHELYHIAIKTHRVVEKDEADKDVVVTRADLDPYERPVVKLIPDDWHVTGFRQVAEWYGNDSAEVRSHRAIGELLGQLVMPFAMAPGSEDAMNQAKLDRIFDRPAPVAAIPAPAPGLPTAPDAGETLPDGGQPFTNLGEALRQHREQLGEWADQWRTTHVGILGLTEEQEDALHGAEIETLGELADYLEEDGHRDLTMWGINFIEASKVLAAFNLWWAEAGDGPLPFTPDGDCVADREKTALLIDWMKRSRDGTAVPAWGNWSEFSVTLENGDLVKVLYDPGKVARRDPRDGHFQFYGPLSSTGYYSHHTGPASSIGDADVEQYATSVARHVAEESAGVKAKEDRRKTREAKKAEKDAAAKAKAAELLVSKSGGEFPGGLVIEPAKRAVPEPVYDLFLVYGSRGQKTPVYAIRAPSYVTALAFVRSQYPTGWKGRVVPDDGTQARLKIPILSTVQAPVVADQVEADEPEPQRVKPSENGRDIPIGKSACSRCNTVRPRTVVVCPQCGGVEYMVNPDEPVAPKRSKTKRQAAEPGEVCARG